MKMTSNQRQAACVTLAVIVAIAITALGVHYPIPQPPDETAILGTSHFTNVEAEDITATNDLTVDDTLNIDDTDSTLSGTQTLTPTATLYQFAPATVLTLTLAIGAADEGDLLILANTVTTNVVVIDTGATVGGGNVTIGQNDFGIFLFSNSKWCEWASPDNS